MNPPRFLPTTGRTLRRAAVFALILFVVAMIVFLVVKTTRTPLAVNLATAWLKRHGVASSIKVTSLSDHAFSARVRLGSPDAPDLTIERLDVTYRLSGPWGGQDLGFTPLTLRLVRPRLRLSLRQGALDFGGLDPLVKWAEALPPSQTPLPDITLERGEISLETPGGPLKLMGDGAFHRGALDFAQGRLAGFQNRQGAVVMTGDGGEVRLDRRGDHLLGRLDFGALKIVSPAGEARVRRLWLETDLPYPVPARRGPSSLIGPLEARLSLEGLEGATRDGTVGPALLMARFVGRIDATPDRQDLLGALTAGVTAPSLRGRILSGLSGGTPIRASDMRIEASVPRVTLNRTVEGLTTEGDGAIHVALGGLVSHDLVLSALGGDFGFTRARAAMTGQGASVGGAFTFGAHGQGALTAPGRKALSLAIPVIGGDQVYIQALSQALSAFSFVAPAWHGRLDSPGPRATLTGSAHLQSATGARLDLQAGVATQGIAQASRPSRLTGSARLALNGGGLPTLSFVIDSLSLAPTGLQARMAAETRIDTPDIHAGRLMLRADLAASRTGLTLHLLNCATLAANSVSFGGATLSDAGAQVCPRGGPLVETRGRAWLSAGQVSEISARSSEMGVALNGGAISFSADGASTGLDRAQLTLDDANLTDSVQPHRFEPLILAGRLDLAHAVWRGNAALATASAQPILKIQVVDDTRSGSGRADFNTGPLQFTAGGLQPLSLTPLASFARQASGESQVQGWVSWDGAGKIRSGGEVVARNLDFIAPFGPVKGVNSDLHFISLSPLITAPGQNITIAELDTVTPLTQIRARFDLGADDVTLTEASATVAKGVVRLDPITIPFDPKASFTGVLDVAHVDVGEILAATSLADEVKLQAKVDGRIPFTVGPQGLTVQNGALAAIGGGRLSISPQALTGVAASKVVPNKGAAPQANFAQDIASQAMDNLAFSRLDATLASLPGDRMGIIFHIKGRHDPPRLRQALIPLMDILRGQALAKPLTLPSGTEINLTLDTSLNFGDLMTSLDAAWRDALQPIRDTPALIKLTPLNPTKPSTSKGTPP